jgi:hypothetical protein
MEVAKTRSEMLSCVAALRDRLVAETNDARRAALIATARQKIKRLQGQFKRQIDERGQPPFWVRVA